ncbi:response regulator [Ideonella sp. 4Y16]|uniref:Sensory/regulatory protein RpfC n=1 Tax=Ideonella alba TaxID=2824118 RepID=A0A941BHC6_9BURK|nr:response regulator [Ideonella alba]MBQ0931473.1 response regulator [Ideonella alba]MBQ0943778.1 response regulator [Ideonella alba]
MADRTLELEASNEALLLARDEAHAAGRAKADFLAHMSHEIRTPMNAIIGLSGLALRDEQLGPRSREYLQHIQSAAQSLLGILNDVLDFSKIEAGKLQIEHEPFVLQEVLDRVTSIVGHGASDKGLDFLLHTAPDVPRELVGDALRLGQVLLNLCGNAVKFTERGEIVVVTVKAEAQDGDGWRLRFSVRDTGAGMDAEQQARLFQPFEQLDASTTRRHGGTGLGLAISRQLVERMGGSISVRSEPGRGSEFTVLLPFGRVPGAASEPAWPQAGQGRQVLVLDDSAAARAILADLLGAMGCGVSQAGTVDEARSLLAGHPHDLALIDWRMPGIDGFEAAERLRQHLGTACPPLVMVTAYGDQGVAARAREAGFSGYLAKPVTPETLLPLLQQRATVVLRPAAAPPPELAWLRGRHLLLAEDNALNRLVAADLLCDVAGARVDMAVDGEQALAAALAGTHDLVLLDVQMPGLDGHEVARRLRAAWGPGRPILAMTAHAMARDRELCLLAGMDDVIVKPYEPVQLFRTLAHWLGWRADDAAAPQALPAVTGGVDFGLGLQRCMGREDLQRRLLQAFAQAHAGDREQLLEALARGELDRVGRLAHTAMSAAGAIGALRLQQQAVVLEAAARSGDLTASARLASAYLVAWEEALQAVRRWTARQAV